jgi:hypothetical protein
LAYNLTLKIEVNRFFETSVSLRTTRRYILEEITVLFFFLGHSLPTINLFMKMLVHSVGEHQSEASPSEAVVNSAVMDGAAVLHQALAGETFLEKERRLSEMIRQLQMLREQLLSQQELQTKVGAAADRTYAYECLELYFHSPIRRRGKIFNLRQRQVCV